MIQQGRNGRTIEHHLKISVSRIIALTAQIDATPPARINGNTGHAFKHIGNCSVAALNNIFLWNDDNFLCFTQSFDFYIFRPHISRL